MTRAITGPDHRLQPLTDEVLVVGEQPLSIEEIVEVGRHRRRVVLADSCRRRMDRCRAMVEFLVDQDEKVYGLNTGFGKLRDTTIPARDTQRLQANLIRSHAAGVGPAFSEEVVRAAMLLRANTLCRGNSGIRVAVVEQLLAMLNEDLYPYVPQQGSVGASGDLAPLSHLALVLMGDPEGRVYGPGGTLRIGGSEALPLVDGARPEDFVALAELGFGPAHLGGAAPEPLSDEVLEARARAAGWTGFRPLRLQSKEGLALNNGTQFMTAVGALVLWDGVRTLRLSELTAAMSLEANRGVRGAYDPRIHAVRPQRHQPEVARRIIAYCEDSQILDLYLNSAHLRRAGLHLGEARKRLDDVRRELERQGESPPDAVDALDGLIAKLGQDLRALLPLSPEEGAADPELVRDWSRRAPKVQIALFDRYLRRSRQQASELIRAVTHASFPVTDATPKLDAELVQVQSQLRQAVPEAPLVQDDYCLRCMPQVLACAWRAAEHVEEIVVEEANAATDNPLLFPPAPPGMSQARFEAMDGASYGAWLRSDPATTIDACRACVIGGGNFHGEPVAIAMDYLTIALCEVGNISERRTAHLVDANASRGLPPFLVEDSGLNSGLMIPQYTAASLVSENKVLAHPASVDSIPTCANSEDHVSMGTIAARQCAQVLGNVREVIAIELLVAWQGLGFRAPLRPGLPLRRVLALLEERGFVRITEDRVVGPLMARMRQMLDDPELLALLVSWPEGEAS